MLPVSVYLAILITDALREYVIMLKVSRLITLRPYTVVDIMIIGSAKMLQ